MMITCPRCWNTVRPCDKCENKGKIPNVKLSDNFTLLEFVHSSNAMSRLIPNDPNPTEFRRIRDTAQQGLQPIRDHWGYTQVTSGFRTEALNQVTPGAAANSAHRVGWGADIRIPSADPKKVMAWLREVPWKFDQAILYDTGRIHFGLRRPTSGEQRRQLLRFSQGKYTPWEEA